MTDDERLTHYDATKHVRYRTEFGANWVCRDCEDINKPETAFSDVAVPPIVYGSR